MPADTPIIDKKPIWLTKGCRALGWQGTGSAC
jgi:hypothetical protein